jgi:aminoglycoside/choline kinase family phosphotransferase
VPDASASDRALEELVRRCAGSLGLRVERVDWLEGQLGLRRFARLRVSGAPFPTLVARIDAPEDPASRPAGVAPEPPLEPIRALLEAHGLPVPRRLGGDPDAGLDLLEDVGPLPLRDAWRAAGPRERRVLYEEACDLVPRLQRVAPADVPAFQRRLDATLIAYKAEVFLSGAPGAASPSAAQEVRAAFRRVADAVRDAPARLSHRDFQSANLLLRPGAPPGRRLVMIDLQGAFLAPPEYDLVCLLRDSYVELAADEVAHQLERVRPSLPDAPDPEDFARRFDLLTLTRKGKDLGRFLYAARARGDTRFLAWVPATVRALRAAAERAAQREPAFRGFAEIVAGIPEEPEPAAPEGPCGR